MCLQSCKDLKKQADILNLRSGAVRALRVQNFYLHNSPEILSPLESRILLKIQPKKLQCEKYFHSCKFGRVQSKIFKHQNQAAYNF